MTADKTLTDETLTSGCNIPCQCHGQFDAGLAHECLCHERSHCVHGTYLRDDECLGSVGTGCPESDAYTRSQGGVPILERRGEA